MVTPARGGPTQRIDWIRAMLFDFDRTLVDLGEHVRWADARAEIEQLLVRSGVDAALIATVEGGGMTLYTRFAHGEFGLSEATHDEVRRSASAVLARYEADSVPAANVLAGAGECLRALRRRGMAVGIVTSNSRDVVRLLLRREGLADVTSVVVARDDVRVPKPSPEGIALACERLGLAPSECIYVGDSVSDIEAARAAGMPRFGVLGGMAEAGDLQEAGASGVFASVGELAATIAPGRETGGAA